MAQVLLPRNPKDQLTAVAQALGVAGSVYGLRTQMTNFERLQKQMDVQAEQEFLGTDPASLALEKSGRDQARFEQEQELGKAKLAQLGAQTKEAGSPFLETRKGQEFIAKEDFKSAKGKAKEGPKKLSQATIKSIDEGRVLPAMLSNLDTLIDNNKGIMGPVEGRVRSLNPYDVDAQVFKAEMKAKAQAFGRFMEGGVLRKEDEEKYKEMFPELENTPEVAKEKLNIVRELLAAKQNSIVKAFKDQGFDLEGFEEIPIGGDKPTAPGEVKGAGVIKEALARDFPNFKVLSRDELLKMRPGQRKVYLNKLKEINSGLGE